MRRLFTVLLLLMAYPVLAQDAPVADLAAVSASEFSRIERFGGPTNTSAHLSPDGERILHIKGETFCLLTIHGVEEECYSAMEATGLSRGDVSPDHDTVSWSPDGRFVAYTTLGLFFGEDTDIWVLDLEAEEFYNVTDDSYEGRILGTDDNSISDGAFLDLAPAWMPDGTLTFARHSLQLGDQPAALWSVREEDDGPAKVADLFPDNGEVGFVMSMDWSADGQNMAYVINDSSVYGGIWLYGADGNETRSLLPVSEELSDFRRVDFSPDATQLLLLTAERDQGPADEEMDGHFVVSVETGEAIRLDPDHAVMNAGWLPDGSGLIYIGRDRTLEEGLFVSNDPSSAGRKVMDEPELDGKPVSLFTPTNNRILPLMVSSNGRLLLGANAELLLAVRLEGLAVPVVDMAEFDPASVSVTEVARLDRRAGPLESSAHLSPDGEHILHVSADTFCLLTISGEEEWCVSAMEQTGLPPFAIAPDHDSIAWSPDGQTVVFTTPGLSYGTDTDIWVLLVDEQQFFNATDDGYDGSRAATGGREIPDGVYVDLAPVWMPDGTVTFARHSLALEGSPAQLWAAGEGDPAPSMVTELYPDIDEAGFVRSMDWSADGQTMAYIVDSPSEYGGLWLYDAASGATELLVAHNSSEMGVFLRVTLSPDGSQILLLTGERDQSPRPSERDGHFIVSTETGEYVRLDPDVSVMSAGWLPDSAGLIYSGVTLDDSGEAGVYVSSDPAAAGHLALTGTLGEDGPYNVNAPTSRSVKPLQVERDGLMLLGTRVLPPVLMVVQIEISRTEPAEDQSEDVGDGAALPATPQETNAPVITEVARLPLTSAPAASSAHLLPDGEHLIHVKQATFCLYTLAGEEVWCAEATEEANDEVRRVRVDPETITRSPDGRYLAFTSDALVTFNDPDIWVLDIEAQAFKNLTDDEYSGSIGFGDDIPDIDVDLAPAWMPDGRLTFARHTPRFNDAAPSLWAVDPAGGEPEKLADFEATFDAFNLVLAMDWSPDGSQMAFVMDSTGNPSGGVWIYEAGEADVRALVVQPDRSSSFLRADFSPDGQWILALTVERDTARMLFEESPEQSGYYVISADTGAVTPIRSDVTIWSAGWLPDGQIIYTSSGLRDLAQGGIFVRAADDDAVKVMDYPQHEGEPLNVFAPTPRQVPPIKVNADGRFVLGSAHPVTLVMVAQGERIETEPAEDQSEDVGDGAELPATPQETNAPVITEVARLPLTSAPAATSAHLLPDGEHLIHVKQATFCLYTLAGEEEWCTEVSEQVNDEARRVRVDPETITRSPDGRYLAFTSDALVTFTDPDIWVLDIEAQAFTNLTDDAYSGSIGIGDDISDIDVDLAPAWMPDGRLTFARHTPRFNDAAPSLWAVDPAGGEPEKLADFEATFDAFNLVLAMDWSPDGSQMAFVMDSTGNPFGGVWVYELDEADIRPLVIPPDRSQGFLRADFSPDGQSILALTIEREIARNRPGQVPEQSGYYVISADTGRIAPITSEMMIWSAGWLPDSQVIYTAGGLSDLAEGGIFVRAADDDAVKVMDYPQYEDKPLNVFAPTPRQVAPIKVNADGRFVLGSAYPVTLVLEAAGE